MLPRVLPWVLLSATLAGACLQVPPPPEGGCWTTSRGCITSNPIPSRSGGTGGRDGGSTGTDAGGITSVTVQGVFSVSATIPVHTSGTSVPVPTDGWQITSVDDPTIPAVTTAGGGLFTLTHVPVVGGGYRLSATPPPGGGTMGALGEFAPTTGVEHTQFVAISTLTLRDTATLAGVSLDETAAHVLVQLSGTATTNAGVTIALRELTDVPVTGVITLYDSPTIGFSASATSTAANGTALLLNLSAPAGGRPLVLRAQRGTVINDYSVTLYPARAEWLQLPPP